MNLRTHTRFERAEWAALRANVPLTLSSQDLDLLRATNEKVSLHDVEEIYLPLARLISLHVGAARGLAQVTDNFVGRPPAPRPYVIAVAGSVAVGKSTVARVLHALLSRWPDHPRVELVTTDGFLWPTACLQQRDLMLRKGFPESYDMGRMIEFLVDVVAGGRAAAPVYSHETYDVVPGAAKEVDQPDILIFEGLNVLQIGDRPEGRSAPAFSASDFFDLSIYVDADPADIEHWYVDRFFLLQRTAFQRPSSYFHHLASASSDETMRYAISLWTGINLPNLIENILPTRPRADLIIHKRGDHRVDELMLRRL